MATLEQINSILSQLEKAPPSESFNSIDKNAAGIQAILKYLKEAKEAVTAGDISKHLGVSTARIAVLLRKMMSKNYIVKSVDENDARLVLVSLSSHGLEVANKIEKEIIALVGRMIDQIGMERMLEFTKISIEINRIIKSPIN